MDLLGLCIQIDSSVILIQNDLKSLEGYAVRFRYPGQKADRLEAKNAIHSAEIIRQFIRTQLDLP